MKLVRLACAVLLSLPVISFAQRKEYVELNREINALHDDVRSLERALNETTGKLTALLQNAIDNANKTNTGVALLERSMGERDKNLTAPVATMGAKVDQMAQEFQALRTSVEDMNTRMGKLERQLVDLGNTIKVMQTPVAPPPAQGAGPGPASGGPPQGMSAEVLYANALRDKNSGNEDLALQGFSEYLKYYGDTNSAPNAQFYIGEIQYNRRNYDDALQAFDLVLEKYPENPKTLDAMYMKGLSLVRLNERNKAAVEFREVYRRAPRGSELSTKAAAQIKSLGLSLTAPASKRPKK